MEWKMQRLLYTLLAVFAIAGAQRDLMRSSPVTEADLQEIRSRHGDASRSHREPRALAASIPRTRQVVRGRAFLKGKHFGRALQSCANITTSTKVDLSNCGLTGTLSNQLLSMGNLSQVSYMDLSGNSFTGPIPSWISNYSSLTLLSLASNSLSGSIPDTLGKLSLLTSLVLGSNSLSGPIPAALGNLTLLVSLDLSSNALTGAIPSSLGNCQALTSLVLSSNSLSSIPASFGNLLSLQSLDLRRNMLTSLPDSLGKMGQLSSLDLARNRLSGPIPDSFGGMSSLTSLVLDYNAFTGTLPSSLSRLSQLTTLSAGANKLSGPLPPVLASLPLLSALELFRNQLSGTIPTWLGALQSLQTLDLSENLLQGTIPDFLRTLTNMRYLSLNQNHLTGGIPNFLANFSHLVGLYLDSNQLSGPIPQALQALPQLSRLFLFNNRLTGPVPEFLCQIRKLGKLYLYSNQLSGTIPPCLGNLSDMVALDLSGNQLTGPIPSSLGNYDPTQFFGLWLNFNNLSGPIPPQLGQLQSLEFLDLSNNQLSGPVPKELGLLSKLQALSLQSNQLSGPLPASLNLLTALETLNATSNRLTGSVDLSGCGALTVLRLGSNQFVDVTGPPQLTTLDASQNRLRGMPAAILQLTGLESLSLSGNLLSTPIPPSLGALTQLSELRLRACNLSGTIPAGLLALPNLTTLDIQDNPLSGTFPDSSASSLLSLLAGNCSFSAISNLAMSLVTLDFSSNKLQGLPPNLVSLRQLSTLKLANNQIAGWPDFGVFGLTSVQYEGTSLQILAFRSPPNTPPLNMQLLSFVDLSNNPLGRGAREVVCSFLYLPNLAYFACSNCQLSGPLTTFYWVDYKGFAQGAAPPLMFKTQMLKQGFQNLLTFNLANNAITELPPTPPPQLRLADFSKNSLSAGGVPRSWFNEGGMFPLASLILVGNPSLRMQVAAPRSGADGGCSQMSQLTAKATSFKILGGVECTSLCPTSTIYATDIFLAQEALCRCVPGSQGSALDCRGCPADTYSFSATSDTFQMSKVCAQCPVGSGTGGLTNRSSACDCKCPIGTYLSTGELCPEPAQSASSMSNVSCIRCPELKTTLLRGSLSAKDCICDSAGVPGLIQARDDFRSCYCSRGYFMNWSALRCSPCKDGEYCDGWNDILASSSSNKSTVLDPPPLLPGFWASTASATRFNFGGHSIYRCRNTMTCIDNRSTCSEGREGRACGYCQPGWWGGPLGPCMKCQTSQATSWILLALSLIFTWPGVVALHVLNRVMDPGSADLEQEQKKPKQGLIRRNSIESMPNAADDPDEDAQLRGQVLRAWSAETITAAFQIWQYYQIMGVVTKVELSLPPWSQALFQRSSTASTSLFDVGGIGCLADQQSAALELGVRWGYPVAVIIISPVALPVGKGLGYLFGKCACRGSGDFSRKLGKLCGHVGDISRTMEIWDVVEVVCMACSQYCVNILVSNGLLLLTCIRNPNNKFTVQNFPHLECPWGQSTETQEFYRLLAPCLVYCLVFVLLIPVGVGVIVLRKVVAELAASGQKKRGKWGDFCPDFRNSHVHWLLVMILKDLSINIITTALVSFPSARLSLISALCVFYAMYTMRERPYYSFTNNLVEVWLSFCVAATTTVLGGFPDTPQALQTFKDVMVLLIQAIAYGGPLIVLILEGLGGCKRTSRFALKGLQPLTRIWRERRTKQLLEMMGRANNMFKDSGSVATVPEQVLGLLDDVDFGVLDTFLSNSAGLADLVDETDSTAWVGISTSQLRQIRRTTMIGGQTRGLQMDLQRASAQSTQVQGLARLQSLPEDCDESDSDHSSPRPSLVGKRAVQSTTGSAAGDKIDFMMPGVVPC